MNTQSFGQKIASVAARTWIAFSLFSFAFAAIFVAIDGDNVLHSDDPYLVGFIAAMFGSICSCALAIATVLGVSRAKLYVSYCAVLAAIAGLLFGFDYFAPPREGQGIPSILAATFLLCGGIAVPLQFVPLTKRVVALCSVPGALLLLGYAAVVTRMWSTTWPS
jgi:hypothetical protein